jgi:transposase
VIADCGAQLHLAHPLGIAGYENRRVKNDIRDATLLADLLRMGRLPEAWVAPPEIRELRELVRYCHKLSRLRAGLKSQVHQTLGKEGAIPELQGIWKSGGQRWLAELDLGDAYAGRIASLRELIAAHGGEVVALDACIHARLKGHPGYEAIQRIAGVGPVFAAVFIAEIGDIDRFPNPRRLCSWAGLTPRHRESDSHVRRGGITKQGSALVRWAAVEAISARNCEPRLAAVKRQVGERRGRGIGRVAAARQLLTLVFYGMRDGHIRCLAANTAA